MMQQQMHSAGPLSEGPLSEGPPALENIPDTQELQRSIVHFVSSGYLDTVTEVVKKKGVSPDRCCCWHKWWPLALLNAHAIKLLLVFDQSSLSAGS